MANSFEPAVNVLSGGLGILKYWWIPVVLAIIGGIVWWLTKAKKKDTQWTHELIVKIEAPDGTIDDKEEKFKMRRWRHKEEKTAPLFELEKPLLGSRIFVELENYSARKTYVVVLGKDGRIYVPIETRMSKDKKALDVSVKHAGIDRARQEYTNWFEKQNGTPKKIDALTLMKYGLIAIAIIVLMVLGLTGLKTWGERAQYTAASAQAELAAFQAMTESQEITESVLNTITLILPDLKDVYGNNIQGAIRLEKQRLNQSNG